MLKSKPLYSKKHITKYALNYLNKFSTSKNYLTKFLMHKIKKIFFVSDYHTLQKDIVEVIEDLTVLGFLNDIAFCESRIKSLLKEGNSIFNITLKLKKKDISQTSIDQAFNNILSYSDKNYTLIELEKYSLLKYAKKSNTLLWQQPDITLVDYNKIINKLLRKGFPFSLVEELVNKENQLNYDQEYYETYLHNLEKNLTLIF